LALLVQLFFHAEILSAVDRGLRTVSDGTIIFVHGTGVRLRSYERTYQNAVERAAACGVTQAFATCAWGDPLGIEFLGKSLPDAPSLEQLKRAEEDFAQWNWLFDDPLFELYALTIRDNSAATNVPPRPGEPPEWEQLWDKIVGYQPSEELRGLLVRGGLWDLWPRAWAEIMAGSPIPLQAFEASAHELADVCRALARSLVAELHLLAIGEPIPGPSSSLRNALVDRLLTDWDQHVFGLGTFWFNLIKRASTSALRKHRNHLNVAAALPIGDVLLYQSRGDQIREFIRSKIVKAAQPVTLMAHSLGGIACVDLLALPNPPQVARLVTAGSQSSFFYEIGALYSLKPKQELPRNFPPWLNFYDRNDFLSFVANPLFAAAKDVEVESGQPFPDSHSAYFSNDAVWKAVRDFAA
jgi:hypothetical protein